MGVGAAGVSMNSKSSDASDTDLDMMTTWSSSMARPSLKVSRVLVRWK